MWCAYYVVYQLKALQIQAMLARKGLVPEGFLLTRLAEDATQPNRFRTKSQRARFITKNGSCNVAHKNIREQVRPWHIYCRVMYSHILI